MVLAVVKEFTVFAGISADVDPVIAEVKPLIVIE